MAELNTFNLYTDSYLADTIDLSTAEHGAYLLLLMAMWRNKGVLPNDHDLLRRITKLSNLTFPKVWDKLRDRFFSDAVTGGKVNENTSSITQNKLGREYKRAIGKKEKNAAAGHKGGVSNALKYKNGGEANASVSLPKRRSENEASLKHTENREPRTDTDRIGTSENLHDKTARLIEAAGGNVVHGSTGIEVIKDILDLEAQGCDFEQDILPTVRARVPRMESPLRTWGARWLRDVIFEAKANRLANRGKAKNGNGAHDEPDWDLILTKFSVVDWLHTAWGPPPGEPGCRVPEEILKKHNLITA